MDKGKKSTLEELMGVEEREAVLADDQADAITLDEPKRRTWLVILLSVLATLLVVGGGYVAWKSYGAEKTLKAEEKIEAPATTKTDTASNTSDHKTVYINTPEGLNLRKEASSSAEVLVIVPYGTKIVVSETSGDWYKTIFDGKTGWIAKLYTSDSDPLVYKNTTYGFQITFPGTWVYKLFPKKAESGLTAAYYVAIPTSDTSIDESSAGVDKGYASLFAVSVFTPSQWDAAKSIGGPMPTLAVQNASYVVAYALPNGIAPSDLAARVAEVKSVVATIKFY